MPATTGADSIQQSPADSAHRFLLATVALLSTAADSTTSNSSKPKTVLQRKVLGNLLGHLKPTEGVKQAELVTAILARNLDLLSGCA